MARAMECQKCGSVVENVGELATKVTCSYCVFKAVGFPEEPKGYVPTGRPAGWHFMNEFVDKDGNVFHKGKEQPKLKGTLEPTIVVRKKIKRRTKEQILIDRHDEKKVALRKAVKKQKDFLNHKLGG
jgi:hypothetical protein|tara:strand:+ start:123 stop:503 length:381 start_codon:yes stop_codon:yes gene_type:complete